MPTTERTFGIEVNLPDWPVRGHLPTTTGSRGEWPPHPARLFSALWWQTWAEDGQRPSGTGCSRVARRLRVPPAIAASGAALRRKCGFAFRAGERRDP